MQKQYKTLRIRKEDYERLTRLAEFLGTDIINALTWSIACYEISLIRANLGEQIEGMTQMVIVKPKDSD